MRVLATTRTCEAVVVAAGLVSVGLCGCGGGVADDAAVVDASIVGPDDSLSDAGIETLDRRPALDLEVGTGDRVFTPITDGEAVNITLGPQGGYHIWTAVRLHHSDVPRIRATITARLESTGALQSAPIRIILNLTADAQGNGDYAGIYNFIDNPAPIRGQRVVLRAEATADDGRTAADERAIVAR